MVVYLLNHNIVNASTLAEKFEVSTRTVQRDMDALNLAGIPIISIQGTNGGYGIMENFKLDKQFTSTEDYQYIITSLMGMSSAYKNKKLEATLEKLLSLSYPQFSSDSKVKLDYSVSREGSHIDEYLKIIEQAIQQNKILQFEYTNSDGNKTIRSIEPIGVIYKWYAWYMLGYCHIKTDYRLFKIARIRNMIKMEDPFLLKHESFEYLLTQMEKQDRIDNLNVTILCQDELRVTMEEYFPNGTISLEEEGFFTLHITVPNNEIGWKGLLYTFGNKIKILEPEELKLEFIEVANEILINYIEK
jgi:predicted DNA-binding transcriptional regulator YafY